MPRISDPEKDTTRALQRCWQFQTREPHTFKIRGMRKHNSLTPIICIACGLHFQMPSSVNQRPVSGERPDAILRYMGGMDTRYWKPSMNGGRYMFDQNKIADTFRVD